MTIHPIILAFATVGLCSFLLPTEAVKNLNGDWRLVIFDQEKTINICAKSQSTCQAAQEAIKASRWNLCEILSSDAKCISRIIEPTATTICEPAPECFAKESNCIKGYNCKN